MSANVVGLSSHGRSVFFANLRDGRRRARPIGAETHPVSILFVSDIVVISFIDAVSRSHRQRSTLRLPAHAERKEFVACADPDTLSRTMPGIPRGADLNSWWRNRAARRQEAAQLASQLRDAQSRFSRAAGNARPSAERPDPNESAADIIRLGDAAVAGMGSTQARLHELNGARQAEQATLASAHAAIQHAAKDRTRYERELAAQNSYESRKMWRQNKQNLRKLAAIAIALAVLFVLVRY
jgi:hypothetical protein